jgi:hypothetical protein
MITAALPDPSQPSFVFLGAALGAFIGATISRIRGAEREALRVNVENWAYFFTAIALLLYLVKVGLDFP